MFPTYKIKSDDGSNNFTVNACDPDGTVYDTAPDVTGTLANPTKAQTPEVNDVVIGFPYLNDQKLGLFFLSSAADYFVESLAVDQKFSLRDDDTVVTSTFNTELRYGGAYTETRGYLRFTDTFTKETGDTLLFCVPDESDTYWGKIQSDVDVIAVFEYAASLITAAFDEATIDWATKPASSNGKEVARHEYYVPATPGQEDEIRQVTAARWVTADVPATVHGIQLTPSKISGSPTTGSASLTHDSGALGLLQILKVNFRT